jgi:hypothetical protein
MALYISTLLVLFLTAPFARFAVTQSSASPETKILWQFDAGG